MITTAVTAAIVGSLALFGVTPTPWVIGAIWLVVKALVVLGIFGFVSKLFQRKKDPCIDN